MRRSPTCPSTEQFKGRGIDPLARFLDYSPETKVLVVGEENVLGDPNDPRVGANQVIRVFAEALYRADRHPAGRPQLGKTRPKRSAV